MPAGPGTLSEAFPHLIPVDANCSAYEGLLTLPGLDDSANLWLHVSNPVARDGLATLRMSDELRQLVGDEAAALLQLRTSTDLQTYLLNLRHHLEQRLSLQQSTRQVNLGFHQQLHQELERVGWSNVHSIDYDTSSFELDLTDASGRQHRVRVQLVGGSLEQAPATQADLPEPLALKWPPGSNLLSVVQQYQQAFDRWSELWGCLDDIDANAHVLEPTAPRRSDVARRLAVARHVFLRLLLDTGRPRGPPAECQFLGSSTAVGPLEARFFGALDQWDPSRLPTANLEALLGVALPRTEEVEEEDLNADCAICYAYYLPDPQRPGHPGDEPEASCPHTQCGRSFHRRCLAEWLGSVDTTTRVLSTLFGDCPYCDNPISVKTLM